MSVCLYLTPRTSVRPRNDTIYPTGDEADSWPDTLLDSAAREALDWTPHYDLPNIVDIMIRDIGGIIENEKKRQNLT
ncbi:hypothetical protein GBAR_LOCUS27047 [Geodia barretti]|uniref:UDP-glucose 4-epimerase n=1 Tax=Geodia barretti TaxID=519541 RepID=A0AA35TK78_GEOBA|nr:hypothetical protein GBAR_LOCUS27047 [Geodia barretti]